MGRLKITRPCERCGNPFHPWGGDHPGRFCSNKCRAVPAEERFWPNVKKENHCWVWTARVDKDGYGCFYELRRAHRFSWFLHYGPVPEGKQILHHCDNPPCVRPSHLYVGMLTDNVRDRTERGRERGELHGMAIVTETQVREIRSRYAAEKISQTALGNEYGLSQTAISQIILKKCWKHID